MSDQSVAVYPQLDFSQLLDPSSKYAVHCSTREQALHFIREVRRQYPDHAWSHEHTRFSEKNGVAYSPYLNIANTRMTYSFVDHYIDMGFVVLEFEDLLPNETEINESDNPIELLFGG